MNYLLLKLSLLKSAAFGNRENTFLQTRTSITQTWEPNPEPGYSDSCVACVQRRVCWVRPGLSGPSLARAVWEKPSASPWLCPGAGAGADTCGVGNMGAAGHTLVLPTSAVASGSALRAAAHLISHTEAEEMQRKRSPVWKKSRAVREREREVELQCKGHKYEEKECVITVRKQDSEFVAPSPSTRMRLYATAESLAAGSASLGAWCAGAVPGLGSAVV